MNEAMKVESNKKISCSQLETIFFQGKDHQSLAATAKSQLTAVAVQRDEKIKVSEFVYQALIQKTVFTISPSFLGLVNGITCYPFAYVRSDLPYQAKEFVQRHELVHLLGNGVYYIQGPPNSAGNAELTANLEAIRVHPWGFVETVFFSINNVWQSYSCSVSCKTALLWLGFVKNFSP